MESDLVEKMLTENPLVVFSLYTQVQSKAVNDLGNEILQCLGGTSPEGGDSRVPSWDGVTIDRAYGLFWLWVLGSYEIVRTMCGAKKCFSPQLVEQLCELKRKLSLLRIPFAKQELPGKKRAVGGEPSIAGFGQSPVDLKYQVKGQMFSARELIGEFSRVFSGIGRADVLADLRTNYD